MAASCSSTGNAPNFYLDCGVFECGFTRARCGECGHDFFVAFSCKLRCICPSCHTKLNFHPHSHLLITDGVFAPDGTFDRFPCFDTTLIERIFRAELLRTLPART